MSFKVVKIVDIPNMSDDPKAIIEMGGQFIKRKCESDQEIIAIAHDADYILTIGHIRPVGLNVIERLEKCRFIQTIGIGYDGIDVEAATDHGIGVLNIPDYCVDEVSDHTMALILACSRRIAQLDGLVKNGSLPVAATERMRALEKIWTGMDHLRGKILGFIGFGQIARTTVPKAKGFGLKILAHDPYASHEVYDALGAQPVGLDQLLRESDFVSLNAALTAESRHMIGLEQLRKMKPTTYLINTARGPLVDNQALFEALTKGYIAGAALDVTEPEPLLPTSPLLKLDNIILTGHSAHASPNTWAALATRPLDDAAGVMQGEWPRGLVNPSIKQKQNCRGPVDPRINIKHA